MHRLFRCLPIIAAHPERAALDGYHLKRNAVGGIDFVLIVVDGAAACGRSFVAVISEAQAEATVGTRRIACPAISNPAARLVAEPAATTAHAVIACSWACRVGLRGG